MKFILVLMLTTILFGCDIEPATRITEIQETFCTAGSIENRAKFTLQCIANANPKSDEEPEDWIHKCEEMAEKTYCQERAMIVTKKIGGDYGDYWKEVSRVPKNQ